MRLINKDKLVVRFIDECCGSCLNCRHYSTMVNGTCGLVKEAPEIKNVVIIPENATNKGVLQAIFPDKKFTEGRFDGWFDEDIRCSLDWLNAPYKKET